MRQIAFQKVIHDLSSQPAGPLHRFFLQQLDFLAKPGPSLSLERDQQVIDQNYFANLPRQVQWFPAQVLLH